MLYIACAVLWLLRFALGASIFSFLGVVIWRLPRGESVVKGRSHCPACGRTLSAAELVPCLSFLVQGGRCRGCGATKVDSYLCIGCGLCTTKCKFDAIHLKKVRDWHAGSYETMPIKVAEGVVKRAGSIVKKAVLK